MPSKVLSTKPSLFPLSSNVMTTVLIGTFFALIGLFSTKIGKFRTTDKVPVFQIIDANKQKEFGQMTTKVKCGVFIKNFVEFNLSKNSIIADMVVWFLFNSDEAMLSTVGQFSFENGDILFRSDPDIKIKGPQTFVEYNCKVSFKASLNFHYFPLEGHKIPFVLTNNFVTPEEMFFIVDESSFGIAKGLTISDWAVKDLSTDTGYTETPLDKNDKSRDSARPKAAFILSLVGDGVRKFMVIFLPLMLSCLLSIFSLVANLTSFQQRQILSTSGFSAVIGYRFVIENMLPPVGYFTTTDYFYLFVLGFVFSIFVYQVVFCWHLERIVGAFKAGKLPEYPEKEVMIGKINSIAFLTLVMLLFSGIFIILL